MTVRLGVLLIFLKSSYLQSQPQALKANMYLLSSSWILEILCSARDFA